MKEPAPLQQDVRDLEAYNAKAKKQGKPELSYGYWAAKLMPYSEKNNGLFEVKECFNEKTQWSGTQTLVTPKGRETFRLLYLKTV